MNQLCEKLLAHLPRNCHFISGNACHPRLWRLWESMNAISGPCEVMVYGEGCVEVFRELLSSRQVQSLLLPSDVGLVKKYQSARCGGAACNPSIWGGEARLWQENCEFWASLSNTVRSCQQTNGKEYERKEGH